MLELKKRIAKFNNYFCRSQEFRHLVQINTHYRSNPLKYSYQDLCFNNSDWIYFRSAFDFSSIDEYLIYFGLKDNKSLLPLLSIYAWELGLEGQWFQIKKKLNLISDLGSKIKKAQKSWYEFSLLQDLFLSQGIINQNYIFTFLNSLIGEPILNPNFNIKALLEQRLCSFAYDYHCLLFNKKI